MSEPIETDVVIVGAGPVGLFAVFECGMLKMRCHVIDALDSTGGQCAALYPEKPIYDIPGYPRIEAADLIRKLEEQIAPFKPVFHLNQQVNRLTKTGEGWELETSAGTRISAKAVIIAAGVGAFGPNRPPLTGIEAYEGKSVFYYVKQREDLRGKRIVIAGGGFGGSIVGLVRQGEAAGVGARVAAEYDRRSVRQATVLVPFSPS